MTKEGREFDFNQLSAVLAVEWNGRRLVLGADLPDVPGAGWSTAFANEPALADHSALKVPHHGSEPALYEPLLERGDARTVPAWIIAPLASKDLPRLVAGGGADRLLKHAEVIEATALPRAHEQQADRAVRHSITELRPDGRHLVFDRTTGGFPDCFVVLSLPPEGEPTVYRGPGSVQITR